MKAFFSSQSLPLFAERLHSRGEGEKEKKKKKKRKKKESDRKENRAKCPVASVASRPNGLLI